MSQNQKKTESVPPIRLDKWLWAARFFKTRALARQAVDGGKVELNTCKAKPSKSIAINDTLKIRQGFDLKVIIVQLLSDKRGPAKVAQTLYIETEESIKKRELHAEQRKIFASQHPHPEGKPNKKQRRLIHKFTRK